MVCSSGAFARRTSQYQNQPKMDDGGKKIMDNVFESMSETEVRLTGAKANSK